MTAARSAPSARSSTSRFEGLTGPSTTAPHTTAPSAATPSSTTAVLSAPVDRHVLQVAARAAGQVQDAITRIGRCAHLPPWPPAPIRSVTDLQHAEATASRLQTHLNLHPCPCLHGLRAHVMAELLRHWQALSCVGRLTIRFTSRTSRVSPEFAGRFAEKAKALAADTAWLTSPPPAEPPYTTAEPPR